MRKYLFILLFFCSGLVDAQVMLPSFQALQVVRSLPTVSTAAITSITGTAAVSGGNISNDGGSAITSRGICWGTSANPSVALSTKTNDGTGSGSFSSNITSLASGTIYYVRAYAVNDVGTAYGTQLSFIALAIGDSYQGGKVAYMLVAGDPGYDANVPHGIIAASADQSNAAWGQEGLPVAGADGTAIGTGFQNTLDIIAGDATPGTAARLCRALTIGGYTDWHLPSKDELNKLYLNRVQIGGFLSNGWYFSSTEGNSAVYAWYQEFSTNGTQAGTGAHKDWALSIRAVRSF